MDNFIFLDKRERKNVTSDEVRDLQCHFYSEDGLDVDDSDEDPTMGYETPVSQHKDSLYCSVRRNGKRRKFVHVEDMKYLEKRPCFK